MKNIRKIKVILLFGMMAFAGIIIFYACKPNVADGLGSIAKGDFKVVQVDGNNVILVNNSSASSMPYWTIIDKFDGSSTTLSGDSAKYRFSWAGTYTIKLVSVSNGGMDSSASKDVTISSNDPDLCANGTMQGFLSGCTQKTWRLVQGAGALGCGPNESDVSWWASNAGDVTGRSCSFNDTYTFVLGRSKNFKYDNGGDYFADAVGINNSTCQDNSTLSGSQTAWESNSSDFSYKLLPGDASHPLGYLKVTGTGAHVGIEKVQNTGQSGTPGSSVTYNITDTATVAGNKQMTLTIYSNDNVWWRFIISTN